MWVFIGLILALMLTVYLFFTWNFNYWKKRGIPYEEPTFFFGNLKDALSGTKHFGQIYCDLYKKFDDVPYFGFFKLQNPTLVIRDLDIIKNVMVKEFNSFSENDFHIDPDQDPIVAGNPFVVVGEEWKQRRAQFSAGMTANKVKLLHDTMTEKCDIMVEYLKNYCKDHPNEPLHIRDTAMKYLTDVIVTSVLGLQLNTFAEPDNVFKTLASQVFVSDTWQGIKNLCYMVAPWIITLTRSKFVNKNMERQLLEMSQHVISARRKYGFLKNDFFEVLMKKETVNEQDVAGKIFGFLTDGIETSSGVIAFCLFELGSNPQIQTKLREELEETAAANEGKISFDEIHKLPYLDMVLNETLRTYPPVLTLNKVCTKEFELPPVRPGAKPFRVPKGMPITIPNYATQQDPQYFQEPDRFWPERFSEDIKGDIPKFAFMPFGEGPRICVGMRLGLTNVKMCVSSLVRNFEIRVAPKTKPKPIPIDPSVFVTRAVGELWLTLRPL